jgi:hypothetical protein
VGTSAGLAGACVSVEAAAGEAAGSAVLLFELQPDNAVKAMIRLITNFLSIFLFPLVV